MKNILKLLIFILLTFNSKISWSESLTEPMRLCLLKQLEVSRANTQLEQIVKDCELSIKENQATVKETQTQLKRELSNIEKRIAREISTASNPNVITSHNRNYFLPLSYVDNPNDAPFRELLTDKPIDNLEAKFQISFKAPIFSNIFNKKDALHFGFTLQSYWQMYNTNLSSPFRETNYQPEIFYASQNDWQFGDWVNRAYIFGIEHQSNGRTQDFSRSWNRVYANFVFEKENWVISFKPWYRIPEEDKLDINQPDGDDNPDIGKYMGNFELATVYQWRDQNISLMLRNNLRSTNRGALQIDWSFPMGSRFKGYVQFFNGYGESLIDYNHSVQRLGFGVLLTDFF